MGTRLSRRVLLRDVGRTALGVVLLGGATGCGTNVRGRTGVEPPVRTSGTDPSGSAAAVRWERASFGFVAAYVVARGGEALVFDTGSGVDGAGPIAEALAGLGMGWGDVGHVLLSHRHEDHVGGLADVLAEAPDATVLAAVPDLDRVDTGGAATRAVVDGDEVLGLRVVATPGHTAGHVSAYAVDAGLLLAGDALTNRVTLGGAPGDGLGGSPPQFTEDGQQAAASVRALAGLEPRTILFGHGGPLETDAAAELQELADSL